MWLDTVKSFFPLIPESAAAAPPRPPATYTELRSSLLARALLAKGGKSTTFSEQQGLLLPAPGFRFHVLVFVHFWVRGGSANPCCSLRVVDLPPLTSSELRSSLLAEAGKFTSLSEQCDT